MPKVCLLIYSRRGASYTQNRIHLKDRVTGFDVAVRHGTGGLQYAHCLGAEYVFIPASDTSDVKKSRHSGFL